MVRLALVVMLLVVAASPASAVGAAAAGATTDATTVATNVDATTAAITAHATTAPTTPAARELVARASTADSPPPDSITNVTVTPLEDEDVDGAAAAFEVTVRANTTLADTDAFGNNPGEPYIEIEVDGTDVAELRDLERSETFETTVTLTASDLSGFEPGSHNLTVELWDKDGAAYDATDLGNDDRLDAWTTPITLERDAGFDVEAGHTETAVGAVVSLRALGEFEGNVSWALVDAPAGSDAAVEPLPYGGTASLRPDEPGSYTVRATAPDGNASATVTVTAGNGSRLALLRRYAPRLHFHRNETYRPTRYEAFVYNARLEDIRSRDVNDPTVFDLAGRSSRWELDLKGERRAYRTYDDAYPVTVYGSVHRNVTFRGERYTAVTYWLFYVFDPKQDDSVAALLAHQSDLETVTLLLQDGQPRWVGTSQHFGGELRRWERVDRTGSHLHLYPALGAHSNYLRDTGEFGGGIPIQRQFINHSSRSTALVSAPLVDYADRTGDHAVYENAGDGNRSYQLVVLTGEEVWSTYEGSFGTSEGKGQVPMRRTRWLAPGEWMASAPVPTHEQVDGTLRVLGESGGNRTVAVENTGAKPHRFVVVVEARPAGAGWNDSTVRVIDRAAVPLGVDNRTTVTVAATPPGGPGDWALRVRLLLFEPPPRSPAEVLDAAWLGNATPTPTATPATAGATTDPGDQQGVPGFGPLAALVALAVAALVARRRRGGGGRPPRR